ncbi:MAG: hypothetical protein CM1200mP29_00570 [Verrucomicrobiota bacterium]|nr:MAG: hypothetical protein CM1200mP29_00570 [Verrucomicrobiota bacterium]
MHCIVTAGPTYEPIDQVRRLTNRSTGRLGTGLAKRLASNGHEVTLLRGRLATHIDLPEDVEIQMFTTKTDLAEKLERLAKVDAVFHAAPVNDFAAGQVFRRAPGWQTQAAEPWQTRHSRWELLLELKPTPKIITSLRVWFEKAFLVGWKYEVDGNRTRRLVKGGRRFQKTKPAAASSTARPMGRLRLVDGRRPKRSTCPAKRVFAKLAGLGPNLRRSARQSFLHFL